MINRRILVHICTEFADCSITNWHANCHSCDPHPNWKNVRAPASHKKHEIREYFVMFLVHRRQQRQTKSIKFGEKTGENVIIQPSRMYSKINP